ncbi:MAG TPA: VWA domain-containing protein, partial [Verrucomicrobiales bacterium]|nr:VWA domain-containing protein [Verrucomicrobiales bacterium]
MRLTFENPQAFWLLTLLPVFIVLKVLADTRARHAVTRLASPRLLDGLLVSKGTGRAWVIFSLELFALAMFAAAMARPQYGSVKEEVKSSGRSLIIAIDASKSMLAQDVKPSRLERAQFAAEDLVRQLSKDRIGLMQFAGTANMLAPFTNDTDAVQEIIQSIDPEGVALGGSNLANAIDYAIDVFHHADLSGQQAMVIFSDGEELQGEALAAARRARDAQIAIISVAVGTAAGELIPDSGTPGGFLKDRNNKPVMTRLHKEVLQQIAEITGGLYLALDGQSVSNSRIETILRKLQRSDMKSKTIETNVDRFRWPLAAGLLSLVAAFLTGIVRRHQSAIRGTALAAAAAALFFMSPVPAQGAEDDGDTAEETTAKKKEEEKTVDGDPWFFYAQGDWKNAVANFAVAAAGAHSDPEIDRVQMGLGAAAFKAATSDPKKFDSGMIEQAIEAFGTALASNNPQILEAAHYNLANSIYERAKAADVEREASFQKAKSKKAKKKYALSLKYIDHVVRQLENSLEHYQESLAFNGANKDAAKKNMKKVGDLVETLRKIRQEKAQQAQGKGEEGEGEGEEGEG